MSVSYGARRSCLGNDRAPDEERRMTGTVPVWRAAADDTVPVLARNSPDAATSQAGISSGDLSAYSCHNVHL